MRARARFAPALAFGLAAIAACTASPQPNGAGTSKAPSPTPAPVAEPEPSPSPLAAKIAERPYFSHTDAVDRNLFGNGFEPGIESIWSPFHQGVHAAMYYVATRGSIPLHYHKAHEETLFVLEGSGALVLPGRRVRIQAGSMVRLAPGVTHGWEGERRDPLKAIVVVTPPYAPDEQDLVESRVDEPSTLAAAWVQDVTSTDTLPALPPPPKGQNPSVCLKKIVDRSKFSTVTVTAIRQGKIPDHQHETHDEISVIFAKAGYAFVRADGVVNVVNEGSIMYLPQGTVHSVEHTAEGHMRAVSIHVPAYDETDFKLVATPAKPANTEEELRRADPGYFRAPGPMNPRVVGTPNPSDSGGSAPPVGGH